MEIRPTRAEDLDRMADIDGTVESADYLHVAKSGEGLAVSWRVERRPLREKLIDPRAMDDETRFVVKQIVIGAEEGIALVAEHDGLIVASAAAVVQAANGTLRLADLRVDYDHRREGLGTAMLYRCIQDARDRGLRAVSAATRTNNLPAAQFLVKAAFDLAGLDLQLHSNHDLVKEAATLFWYASLD